MTVSKSRTWKQCDFCRIF